jgi:hypothetical protein
MSRNIVRLDQYGPLAIAHEIACPGEDEVGDGAEHLGQKFFDHLYRDVPALDEFSETMAVDSASFNDEVWIDIAGHPISESLHVQERFRRRDFVHMDVQITIDDPKMYTKPFTFKVTQLLLPDSDILEAVCAENEKDRAHMSR